MNCPRCDTPLSEVKLEEVVLDRCMTCGGFWMDYTQLERILTRESSGLRELMNESGHAKSGEEKPITCPRCGAPLIKMRATPEPVAYYACISCYGRWLDGSEMERIAGRSLAIKFEKLFKELLD